MKKILFVPSVLKGNGTGHIIRCLELASKIENSAVFFPQIPSALYRSKEELCKAFYAQCRGLNIVSKVSKDEYDLIILDNRSTSFDVLNYWKSLGNVIALDEGGMYQESFSYLINTLPRFGGNNIDSNISKLSLLSLPSRVKTEKAKELKKVLVSFGGEDANSMASIFINKIFSSNIFPVKDVTLLSGALSETNLSSFSLHNELFSKKDNSQQSTNNYPELKRLSNIQNLKEHLYEYDLVFTQFGLTAFEAAFAGCAVILLSQDKIHEELAKTANFPELGLVDFENKTFDIEKLKNYLSKPEALLQQSRNASPKEKEDLAQLLNSLEPVNAMSCPICGSKNCYSLYRNERKTYLRCTDCDFVRMAYFESRKDSYTHSYFNEEYKKQYGKTYEEDIPNIRKSMKKRLEIIESIIGCSNSTKQKTLLDVGCAYGAMIYEAKDRFWKTIGLDLAQDAVEYVKNHIQTEAIKTDFSTDKELEQKYTNSFDCISMWYVIEHFEKLDVVLKKVYAMLKPKAVFCFSTPSISGISSKNDMDSFLEKSPDDHFSVWNPKNVSKILLRYGFETKKIVITGHHPERFKKLQKKESINKNSFIYKTTMMKSKLFGLGDTFECYAIKK